MITGLCVSLWVQGVQNPGGLGGRDPKTQRQEEARSLGPLQREVVHTEQLISPEVVRGLYGPSPFPPVSRAGRVGAAQIISY